MKIGIIVQARLTSVRFPNKVLANLNGQPVLKYVLDTVSKMPFPVVVAIPLNPDNDFLYMWLIEQGYTVFRGKQHDVLDRFLQCGKRFKFDIIIRVNGETPFIKTKDILYNLSIFQNENRFSYGNGSWVFSLDMLADAWNTEWDGDTRQEVVRRFYNSVDYPEDIKRLEDFLNGHANDCKTIIQN